MTPENLQFFILYFISFFLSFGIGFVVWQRKTVSGSRAYAIYTFATALAILGYIFELSSTTLTAMGFWDDFQWLAVAIYAVAFPLFCLQFSYIDLTRTARILLFIIPAIMGVLALTNPLHHLIRGESWVVPGDPFPSLMYEFTVIDWIFSLYVYGIVIFSLFVVIRKYLDASPIFRVQVGLVTIGAMIPLIGSVMALAGVTLTGQRDISPLTFALGNLFVGWGLLRYDIFRLVPVARHSVVDTMKDLVLVLDPEWRVIDVNQAALDAYHQKIEDVLGQHIGEVYPTTRAYFDQVLQMESGYFEFQDRDLHYDVLLNPICSRNGKLLARVFVAHDVTPHIRLREDLHLLNDELEKRVGERTRELAETYNVTLEGWARALELRDQETEGHCRRVTGLTVLLAEKMGFNLDAIEHIRRGALLHDIGKMGIPDRILRKPGPLTEAEFEVVKQHPLIARQLLEAITFLQPALNIPYYHHERWDGLGYPEGLQGEAIPLEARIFTVVDNWDALNSDRPYRPAWHCDEVIAYLDANKGKIFDARVVEVFKELLVAENICG